MGFKRVYYRADFDDSMSAQDKLNLIDDVYKECDLNGVDGVIIGRGEGTTFILEGEDSDVDARVSSLDGNDSLENGETIHEDNSGTSSGMIVSHSDHDKRQP